MPRIVGNAFELDEYEKMLENRIDRHKFVNKIKAPRKSGLGLRMVGRSDEEWGEIHLSPSSERLHKGLETGRPYAETAIARDINNVKKRRG